MMVKPRAVIGIATMTALATLLATPALAARHRMKQFQSTTFWTQEVGATAPTDPASAQIMGFIKSDNAMNYVTISGTSSDGRWGTPVYDARDGDPTYSVRNSCWSHQPPEFASMRVPAGARPDPTTDASMVVFDGGKGLEYGLWHASYDATSKQWSSCGGTVYYLGSNGIVGTLSESNDKRNYGHRGVPPSTYAVTYNEITSGSIDHMLRIAVDTTKCSHVFPMSGDECGTSSPSAPPEGAIIRIKQSVNLSSLGLSGPAMVIARALQSYGAVISDQSGASVELKVENTVAEGRGWLWSGVLGSSSLAKIPLDDYEVVKLGYGA